MSDQQGTEWSEYYESTNYGVASFQHKKQIVAKFLDRIDPVDVWDLGANIGVFSRLASDRGIETVAFDVDPAGCREIVSREPQKGRNPHSAIGFGSHES